MIIQQFDWGDGKVDDTDKGWSQNGMPTLPARVAKGTDDGTRGGAQTQRTTNERVKKSTDYFCRAWIDTSKLRERLGYR